MIVEETLQKLRSLRLYGIVAGLEQQRAQPETGSLSFEDRLGLLVDQEWTFRENRKLDYRLRCAKLRMKEACVEQIDYQIPRKLNKTVMLRLANSDWVVKRQNLIITGPTGSGKSFLACALAQKACRDGYTALYTRVPRLLYELALSRSDGSYGKRLQRLARIQVLVLDDWGLAPLQDAERRDLLEILEDRHDLTSTIIASQIPISKWHDSLGDPTIADAICDRVIHNAHRIELKGESVRKTKATVD
jgi:DNA replication protein DnaC